MNQPGEIKLKDAFKGFTQDQDKLVPPEETVARFKNKLHNEDLRILQQTMRIDTGRLDIPVYFSVCTPHAEEVIGTTKQMGKGATPVQAEASAIMELAERYSFFSFLKNDGNFQHAAFKDLEKDALPFDLIARSVDEDRDSAEQARKLFEELPLKWTWGYNLTREKPMLVPFTWFFAINEFNGPSAGNCVEEALSQGICEVVERDVSARVCRGRLKRPGIRADSAQNPLIREMLGKYEKNGIILHLTDFSLDTHIPTVAVLAYDPATIGDTSEIVWTAGTTPNPEKALSRALTEVAQLAGDFETGANYVASGLPKPKSLNHVRYVTNPDEMIQLDGLPDLSNDNIRTEVENLIQALARKEMEVVAIDTLHHRLEIPAFYTIIPGALFRERAVGTSVGMICAKIVSQWPDTRKALSQLSRMDRFLPNRYYIQFYRGICHLNMGETEKALSFFTKSLDQNPEPENAVDIYSYMGVCLKEKEAYEDALEILEKGEKIDPDRTDILNLNGFCNFKLGRHQKAVEAFEKVIRIDPSSAIDYANAGVNYQALGQRKKARAYFQLALQLDPNIQFARDRLKELS